MRRTPAIMFEMQPPRCTLRMAVPGKHDGSHTVAAFEAVTGMPALQPSAHEMRTLRSLAAGGLPGLPASQSPMRQERPSTANRGW